MKNEKIAALIRAAKRHKRRTAVIAVLIVACLIVVKMRMGGGQQRMDPSMMGAAQMDNVATVNAEYPSTGSVERTTSTSGTIEASDVVYVYAKAAGDVTSVNVNVGDMVTAGQLLCTIDTEQVESAKNSMDSAAVSLSEAQSTLNRMQLLYQGGDISDQEWEQYQNAVKTAQLSYDSAKLNYEKQVEYSSVTAPISGKVETVDIEVYDHLNQQDQLCVISGEGDKRVSFYVTERVVGNLSQGDSVTIEKEESTYEGVITDVSTMADESNGLFKINAALPEANALATGTTVKVTVVSQKAENVMTVPVDAIYYDGGGGNVYIYEDGKVHKVEVEVGLYDSERAEIKSGLTGEELVISTWSSQLYEGSTVNLREEETGTETSGSPETAGTDAALPAPSDGPDETGSEESGAGVPAAAAAES